ncbi:polysaccharide biosynthesis tyrosine autokinase [Tamlana fucoidanivorans]|nr:tyrosine-protein kinase [Tamlana fucoidanivorans]
MENNNIPTNTGKFNLKKAVMAYVKRWKWFALSVLVCALLAFLKNRYTVPVYSATAKIMLLDNNSNPGNAVLKDLSFVTGQEDNKVEDEIQVIKSRNLIKNVVEKLNLNIQFFSLGKVNEYEMYSGRPFDVQFLVSDSVLARTSTMFYIKPISESHFEYKSHVDEDPKTYTFDETISTAMGGVVISKKGDHEVNTYQGRAFKIKVTPVKTVAKLLKEKLSIFPAAKGSKVIDLFLESEVENKSIDIINTLVNEYNLVTVEKNKLRAKATANFINDRVEAIASDLLDVEDSIVRYKSANKITDISSKSGMLSSSSLNSEQQLQDIRIQLNMLNYMKKTLETGAFDNLPANLGGSDPALVSLASRYNELIEQRRLVLKSAGENNSVVIQLEQTLKAIKSNLSVSIDNNINTLNIQLRGLQNQLSTINSKISSVPVQESKLISISRKQSIKESLYLYLLEKREEAEISQTTTMPSAKIVEPAYGLGTVQKRPMVIYAGALFIGLLIPFLIIYVVDLLDTKIHNKEDLQDVIKNIPVLGEIPNIKENQVLIKQNDRSLLSESFRIIRTNFDFIKKSKTLERYGNVVFVTSTIKGEGKSFVSLNAALTLSHSGHRVLVIGADLRNPQLAQQIKKSVDKKVDAKTIGLSEYLADSSVLLGETINSYNINGIKLDVLLSGRIPPNPAELLMSDRVKTLFDTVSEQYDYVIVDTAPSMLVTDTLIISEYAGYTMYLVRAGYTDKAVLNFTKEIYEQNKLQRMMLIVNDVKQSNFGYGAKYGYYASDENKGLFSRLKGTT